MDSSLRALDQLASTFSLRPAAGRSHLLRLSGVLLAGWEGRLTSALAARQINILSATAHRTPSRRWEVEARIESLDPKLDLSTLDFYALTHEYCVPASVGDVAIQSYRLAPDPGSLRVEIRAADTVGFLGRILRVFARFALFPCEMVVDTRGTEIVDVFLLQTKNGTAPAASLAAQLDERLKQLCLSAA